jgi:hypothetical protein
MIGWRLHIEVGCVYCLRRLVVLVPPHAQRYTVRGHCGNVIGACPVRLYVVVGYIDAECIAVLSSSAFGNSLRDDGGKERSRQRFCIKERVVNAQRESTSVKRLLKDSDSPPQG